ncbi:Na+/H+ antiporter NhaA, partial [Pseudomonadota bacterium]
MVKQLREFLRLESAGGILLVIAMALAMIVVNTGLWPLYKSLLSIPLEIRIGEFEIAKPLLLWINDGLMAIFFFLIGLEVKRELLEGELSDPAQVMLPAVAAIGGVVVPALVFTWFNYGDESAMQGWAIP